MLDAKHSILLTTRLKKEEGYREKPYKDIFGNMTGGFGHLILRADLDQFQNLTREDWLSIFMKDVKEAIVNASELIKKHCSNFDKLSQARILVICDMCFQMGKKGVDDFKEMWKYIADEQYVFASSAMLDSKWYRSCKERARRLAEIMRTDIYKPYYFSSL